MNFSSKKYVEGLWHIIKKDLDSFHTITDCFYQLIDNVEADMLDNLIQLMIDNKELIGIDCLSKEDCYKLIKNKEVSDEYRKLFLDFAYQCIDSGKHLGSGVNEFGINKSSWISHSLVEARLCSTLASKCGLDTEKAFKLGLLHDYGRKFNHGPIHPILGMEKLFDLGYYEESIGCLTHSFLNGNFFACYAPSKNYIVDEQLRAIPTNMDIVNSDLFSFLTKYTYSDYDRILNIADLMATDGMVVSPERRILDIEKRRKIEGRQREFFISQLLESINWCLMKLGISINEIDSYSFEFL